MRFERKKNGSLYLCVKDADCHTVPVVILNKECDLIYIALDEVTNPNLLKKIKKLTFEKICSAVAKELKLDFKNGWLIDNPTSDIGISLGEDLSDYYPSVIIEQKTDWINANIGPFTRLVVSKIFTNSELVTDEKTLNEYREQCFQYLYSKTV